MIEDTRAGQKIPKTINCFYHANKYHLSEEEWKSWITTPFSGITHFTWAFFKPMHDGSIEIPFQEANELQLWNAVSVAHANGVKVLVSLGGWSDSRNFPIIAADPFRILRFVDACQALVRKFSLDGIDIDWEYPGHADHNGTSYDSENCVHLIRALGSALKQSGKELNLNIPGRTLIGNLTGDACGFKIRELIEYVDKFNIMAYDLFATTSNCGSSSWHSSALLDDGLDEHWSASRAARYYLDLGIPARKMQLGLAFYGRGYRNCSGLGASYEGLGGYKGSGI